MNNIDLEKLQIKRKIHRLNLRLKYLEDLEAIDAELSDFQENPISPDNQNL